VGLSHLSDIQPQDFRRYHPGGKLGVRLLMVDDLMHTGAALPIVSPSTLMQEVVIEMSRKGFGTAIVELWLNLGDAHFQAARFSASLVGSTPSLNVIPSMTFGN